MHPFDVYPLFDIEPVSARGCTVTDAQGIDYLDLYGGHAVISIGHSHPHYIARIERQLHNIGFYSNAVQNSLQKELAHQLGAMCGYPDYALFLCNSGAEANENALKLAAYHTGREKVLAFSGAFHGRTAGAVACTDNPAIRSPFSFVSDAVTFVTLNDIEAAEAELATQEYAAVIIEGIQGVAGIVMPNDSFLQELRRLCTRTQTPLILDEIQSGYGRTCAFFCPSTCRGSSRPHYGG
jgi:acetylornithine aminotransferase